MSKNLLNRLSEREPDSLFSEALKMDEKNNLFNEKDIIYSYTSQQAEEDGYIVDITKINPSWKHGLFNYVTTNLLSKGYIKDDTVNIPNMLDLLNQSLQIVKNKSQNFTVPDTFFAGKIEFPDGEKKEIFIEMNETGKYTLMLPEDR